MYQWVLIEDVEVAKALADAARAKDTADDKRRVFASQPVPPYDVGDLWAQGDGVVICHSEGYQRGIANNHKIIAF